MPYTLYKIQITDKCSCKLLLECDKMIKEAIDNFPIDCFINLLEQCKRLDIHPEILEDMDMYIRLIQDFLDTIKSDGYDDRISYYSALNDITNGIDCFNGILSSDIIQDQHLINECQDWLIILLQFLKCPMP